MKRRLAFLLLLLVLRVISSAVGMPPGDATKGKAVYQRACLKCHAATGDGVPAIAKALKVTFRPLGSAEIQKKTDGELEKDITKGTGKMKPVTGLSAQDIQDVIAYVRSLAKKQQQ